MKNYRDAGGCDFRSRRSLRLASGSSSRGGQKTLHVPPVQIGQAALLGQMTTGFPVSPLTPAAFLVAGLTGIEFGEHQRYTAPFLFAASVLMTVACTILGVFPL